MTANPDESNLAGLQLGQAVRVKVQAYPDRNFGGSIAGIASSPDPENRRAVVCAEVRDPDNLLHPRMTATFTIDTGPAVTELAVPADAVVADGKNTMAVFVTSDGRSFTRRTIRTGAECGNMRVVLSGVLAGEQVAVEGAIFLSLARARARQ
jgi:cobalt-zinc-cadmium efflux system membrane fusion protein